MYILEFVSDIFACLQSLLNPLFSQPFNHYNTQPVSMQQSQQGQGSQNRNLHYNGWGTQIAVFDGLVFELRNLVCAQ